MSGFVRREYLKQKSKREKSKLLDEAEKRTGLERKYLIKKLKPKSNLDKRKEDRKKRKVYYDGYVKVALVQIWRIFDYPCGQRLEPLLKTETDKLRKLGEIQCADEVAEKLKKIYLSLNPAELKRAIDRKLDLLYQVYQKKNKSKKIKSYKKQKPISVLFLTAQPDQFQCHS